MPYNLTIFDWGTMKKVIFILVVIFLSSSFISPPCVRCENPVGFDFLRTLVGARPSAMAGAFIAIPSDIHNIVYNPAGLATLTKRQGTLTYLNHLLDFQSGFLAYAHPISKGVLAIGLHFFDFGQFEGKDENNLDTGEFGANSISLSLSYSRMAFENLSIGGSAKYIRFQIDNLTETALAVDFGVMYAIPSEELNIGVGIFNLGTTTGAFFEGGVKDKLPFNFQLGASKKLEYLPLLVSGALVKFIDESLDFRIGGEFSLTEELFLRLGYNSVGQDQKVDTNKDRLAGVSLGLGFKVNTFNLDYSFSSFGEVGSLNRISLTGRF
ncbi:MAG: PorV/PorQ family protein [bacterium]